MAPPLPYNPADPQSIHRYAQGLLKKSLRQVLGDDAEQAAAAMKGKGDFGQLVEKLYFLYEPNSKAEPDFPKAGVELKTTPLKKIGRGMVSKERLVFNIINYEEEYEHVFRTSSFWRKNQHLLLLFYLHEAGVLNVDYVFEIIRLWRFPVTDLKIIKDDWEKIVTKIRQGRAHELSEGDTLYLGACTKGANKESLRKQPFSAEPAMQRAFSLKSKYLNFIVEQTRQGIENTIDEKEYERVLAEGDGFADSTGGYDRIRLGEVEPVVKSIEDYAPGQTFEELVIARFQPYIGMSEDELVQTLGLEHSAAKSRYYLIAKAVMGVSNKKIEEFEKGDVAMKTIRLERSGTLKESMSFAQIQYKEIIHETWEDSYWYNTLTKRFFFVVFKRDATNTLRLQSVKFWTMPPEDLEVARQFWEDTKAKIEADDYTHFIRISDDMICHVRPKGTDSHDLMETPTDRMEKKKCYWLNASYIRRVIGI
ncbi:DNA mismatch repair protein MutH [Parapedobacter pyrenivorans]|uniref:DNA mismatch repair protein MutH n=1 Tax=Parapedobacter pyrenivorans TaxID=1305674 RepID=A0A917HZR6_9SPHI|nr:MutH/Sau3AI family endonuclease [Parapedobacter pyrenivorans]GGH00185.1 DNA mismatch repair protein MutH [Parapedobacter pyrenivorans]